MSHFRLALALAGCIAVAPFALDAYLPAFPAMAESLGVTVHDISLSASIYMVALSLGQLIGGPLADRFGRQRIMLGGLALFVISSLAVAQAQTLTWLLMARAVQAFGGGWIIVCVPALVRDHTQGKEAARLFSLIGLITVAAPAVAPSFGSLLMHWGGWATIFYAIAAYGVVAALNAKRTLFSGRPWLGETPKGRGAPISVFRRYLAVLKTPSAIRYVCLQASVFSVMMLFVTHASFVYQEHFAVTNLQFSLLFGANILIMWCVMLLNRWLLGFHAPAALLKAGVTLQGLGVALLLVIVLFESRLLWFAPALMMTVGAVGATSPNCQACYMEHFASNGGTAAALMGAMQFGIAGAVSTASTLLPETLESIVMAQAGCALVALTLVWWPVLRRRWSTA
ncbi:multidrug effflux MFS transporter [Marinimicrobium agarilyticum]|uniref:multidrug effflux MFS transporter n=1 Tax=Marinimicrobium agarilyticum TaxID=306546 RepID=UPI000423116E|nr:multidrug effflux MFS transporter [Marinimicrobium agarilyticum]